MNIYWTRTRLNYYDAPGSRQQTELRSKNDASDSTEAGTLALDELRRWAAKNNYSIISYTLIVELE